MADINNNDIWIDVETLAKLKNITRRAVRLALNQNKYEYKVENIRGGKTYKIKLSTLEEELQLKYFQEYYDNYKTCDNEVIELSNLNRFRQIVKVINKAETIAKANGLSSIDEILIKKAIQNETENSQTDKDSK